MKLAVNIDHIATLRQARAAPRSQNLFWRLYWLNRPGPRGLSAICGETGVIFRK